MEKQLERIAIALERIADVLSRDGGPAPVIEAVAMPTPEVATQPAVETLSPLAEHVARLAEGLERMTAVNAEIAATRREIIEQRRQEHLALLEELHRGSHTHGA